MPRRLAAVALVIACAAPPLAAARAPLKPADMKTIRRDARTKARVFAREYRADDWKLGCEKTTPFSARCRVRLVDIGTGTRDCSVILVYVVTAGSNGIAGDVGRNTCA